MRAKSRSPQTLAAKNKMKKYILILIVSSVVCIAYGETKPLMPVQAYIWYRRSVDINGDAKSCADILNKYRLPTEDEKRAYLYSKYMHIPMSEDGPQSYSFSEDTIVSHDIYSLCSWLMNDSPTNQTPNIVEFIKNKNSEFEELQSEFIKQTEEKKTRVDAAMLSLGNLGTNAMPYYMEFLKSDSKVLYEGACRGISELFKNEAIPTQTKKQWIREFIDIIWYPNTPCREALVQELLLLDEQGHAPMDIKDWVSICTGETDITVFERVHFLYPKEFREWEKKEGGFRPLVWE
jgi:hypothetical protein